MIIPDSLPAGLAPCPGHPVKILFVCLGNICRSPAAEGVMRNIVESHHDSARFIIDSAGTGGYHVGDLPDRRMRVHALRRGLTLDHVCRKVTADDFYKFDIIIGMDHSNVEHLKQLAPSPEMEKKVASMARWFGSHSHYDHVPDPYYEGAEGFELVLDLLADGCRNLYDTLNDNSVTCPTTL